MQKKNPPLWLLPLRIITIYAIVGALWILLSDKALLLLVKDREAFTTISLYKGWAYVGITAFLLYLLMFRDLSAIFKLNREMKIKNETLAENNKELSALYQQLYATESALHENYDELNLYKEQLEAQTERYLLVIRASQEGFLDDQLSGYPIDISPLAREIIGLPEGPIQMDDVIKRIHHDDIHHFNQLLQQTKENLSSVGIANIRIVKPNNVTRWCSVKWIVSYNLDEEPTRYTYAIEDIHESHLMTEKIKHLAFHDIATGFFNRDYFLEHLHSRKLSPSNHGVMLVASVLEFERISTLYGKNFAEIVHYQSGLAIKEAFGDNAVFAMLDKGQFCVYIETNTEVPEDSTVFDGALEVLYKLLAQAIGYRDYSYHINLCIGGAIAFADFDIEDNLQNAEHASHHAKEIQCFNAIQWFSQEMRHNKEYRRAIENSLKRALENDEMYLVYQPQFSSLNTKDIVGVEALIRWQHPQLGMISPDTFISIAEETHIIEEIGRFVIAKACAFAKVLSNAGLAHISVSINASILELIHNHYADHLLDSIAKHNLLPSQIHVEITETAVSKLVDVVREHLNKLRDMSIQIHLDDFGTGYSSLSQIGTLPLNIIKIDRSFISKIEVDPKMRRLTSLIIHMGHTLGLQVVAEGVEELQQYETLKTFKCDFYQGYLFSRPITEDAVLNLLSDEDTNIEVTP